MLNDDLVFPIFKQQDAEFWEPNVCVRNSFIQNMFRVCQKATNNVLNCSERCSKKERLKYFEMI